MSRCLSESTDTGAERRVASVSMDKIRKAINTVKAAVPNRSPKPVLLNVLLADGSLTASDLEIQIKTRIDYDGDPVLLPHSSLSAILNAACGDEMTIEIRDSRCVITVGNGLWILPTTAVEEFPAWESKALTQVASMPSVSFARAINATAYATDTSGGRCAMAAVLIERKGDSIAFVATDSRRAASVEFESGPASKDMQVLVPRRASAVMAYIASQSGEEVRLEANDRELVFTQGETVIKAVQVSGVFPRWRGFFADRGVAKSVVLPEQILTATLQAEIVTSDDSKCVTYGISKDGIRLSAKSSKSGESSAECPLEAFGVAASMSLDPSFVADVARSVNAGEPLEIEAVDSVSSVVFRSGEVCAVVMPACVD